MQEEIKIPFGYRRITGPSQRGDGIWDGTRFRKVKKEYPHSEGRPGFNFIIRKCEVVQAELPGTEEPAPADIMAAHQFLYYVKCSPIISDQEYDMFCKQHGFQGGGGSDRAQDYSEDVKRLAGVMAFSPAEITKWKTAQGPAPGVSEPLDLSE